LAEKIYAILSERCQALHSPATTTKKGRNFHRFGDAIKKKETPEITQYFRVNQPRPKDCAWRCWCPRKTVLLFISTSLKVRFV